MRIVHSSVATEPASAQTRARTRPAPGAPARITAPVLVGAAWLIAHHHEVRVLDARPRADRQRGYIPGSVELPDSVVHLTSSARPDLAAHAVRVRDALAAVGIEPIDHLVLVDDGDGAAALGAALCEVAGVRRVSVVHGDGTRRWAALGGELAVGAAPPAQPAPTAAWAEATPRHAAIAAFEDLVDAVVDGTAHVLDVRSQLEHEGIVGAHCCAERGAIPGSIHLEWTSLLDFAGEPCGVDALRFTFEQIGVDLDQPIIVTCHAGHRAAIAARIMRAAGARDVRLAPGSWHEWSHRGLADDSAADQHS